MHCLHAGHRILGDDKYGSEAESAQDRAMGIQRLCQHADRIALPEGVIYESPIPQDFRRIWQDLSRASAGGSVPSATEDG